jgi:phage terminase large subunit-like protein
VAITAPEARSLADLTDAEAGELVHVYARSVVAGTIVAGRKVRLACERHLRWLAESRYRFDAEAAGHGIRFYPVVLRHYKGEWGPIPGQRREGLPVELELWECFIVGSIFGWLRRDDAGEWIRLIRKAFVEIAKKNGKTLLFGGLGIKLAFFDGEPGAEVYSAASKRDQAKYLWGDAAEMIRRSPALSRRLRVPPRDRPNAVALILDVETTSKFMPLSSDARGEEGVNSYASLVDELHRLSDRGVFDMLGESGAARRWSFLGMITTGGEPGPSIWAEEHEYAERVLEGIVEDDSLLAYIANLDEGDDWRDETVWPKANPNLGVSVKVDDLRRAVQEAIEKPGKRPAILRLRFNLRTSAAARVVDLDAWAKGDQLLIAEEGAEAWAGLDLGWSRDLSAFTLWIPNEDGSFDWLQRFWCPEASAGIVQARDRIPYVDWAEDGLIELTEGNVRDDDAIVDSIVETCRPFKVRRIRYDRAMSTNIVNRLLAEGFELEPQSQTLVGIGPAWKEFDRLYRSGRIRHGGNPVLRWMAGNVQVRADDNGNERPVKPHQSSIEKIDGIASGLDAIAGWLADGVAAPAEPDAEPAILFGRPW